MLVAGAACCAAGVYRRWQAPTLIGAGAVALVAGAQLASHANALPRWLLLALVGAALLILGIRYERVLLRARATGRWVEAMS